MAKGKGRASHKALPSIGKDCGRGRGRGRGRGQSEDCKDSHGGGDGDSGMDLAVALFEKGFAEASVKTAISQCSTLAEAVKWLEQNAPKQSAAEAAPPASSGAADRAAAPNSGRSSGPSPSAGADAHSLAIALLELGFPVGLVVAAAAQCGGMDDALDWIEQHGDEVAAQDVAAIEVGDASAWWRKASTRWRRATAALHARLGMTVEVRDRALSSETASPAPSRGAPEVAPPTLSPKSCDACDNLARQPQHPPPPPAAQLVFAGGRLSNTHEGAEGTVTSAGQSGEQDPPVFVAVLPVAEPEDGRAKEQHDQPQQCEVVPGLGDQVLPRSRPVLDASRAASQPALMRLPRALGRSASGRRFI